MHFLDSLFWFFPELIDFLFFRCKHKYHNIDVVDGMVKQTFTIASY